MKITSRKELELKADDHAWHVMKVELMIKPTDSRYDLIYKTLKAAYKTGYLVREGIELFKRKEKNEK